MSFLLPHPSLAFCLSLLTALTLTRAHSDTHTHLFGTHTPFLGPRHLLLGTLCTLCCLVWFSKLSGLNSWAHIRHRRPRFRVLLSPPFPPKPPELPIFISVCRGGPARSHSQPRTPTKSKKAPEALRLQPQARVQSEIVFHNQKWLLGLYPATTTITGWLPLLE